MFNFKSRILKASLLIGTFIIVTVLILRLAGNFHNVKIQETHQNAVLQFEKERMEMTAEYKLKENKLKKATQQLQELESIAKARAFSAKRLGNETK